MSEEQSRLRDLEKEISRLRRENAKLKKSSEKERRDGASRDYGDRAEIIIGTLLEQAQYLAGIVDLDGVLKYANRTARDFIRKDPSEFIGKMFWETPWFTHSREMQDSLREGIRRAAGGEFAQFETMISAGDGSLHNMDLTLKPARDEDGRVFCIIPEAWNTTGRKRVEEALEKRLVALTQPLEDTGNIAFENMFNLSDIQNLQDLFAKVCGVASIITMPDGTPITKPSNFTYFCSEFICNNPKGFANCMRTAATVGRHNPTGPNIQPCPSAGLCDAGASITVGGRHIANWLIGQVRNDEVSDERILKYARELGIDETAFHEAFLQIPIMPQEQFNLIAQTLFVLANQLSTSAYQNIQQARFITERKRAEEELMHRHEFERLITGISTRFINLDPIEIDPAINDSLRIIGEFTGADRSYLFFFRENAAIADNTHEWCGKGIESHIQRLKGLRIKEFAYLGESIMRSEVVHIPHVADLPIEDGTEKTEFEIEGIQSIMLVPIEFRKAVVGFLGLDAVHEEKTWPPDIAALLRIAGEVFAGALERQKADAALFLKEEWFKLLLQNSNDITTVIDSNCVLQNSINGPIEKIVGYAPGELIGKNAFEFIHPDDVEAVKRVFNELLLHPDSPLRRAEFRFRHKNGSWITLEVVGNNLLHDPVVKGLVLNIRDVSERNRLQDQLQQAMKMEAVGRLAGGVAHDFNNLLTSIICNIELAGQGLNPSDPLVQNLNEANVGAQSAASLTRQLLAFSRKQIIEPEVLNLNDLVGNIQKMLIRIIGEDIEFKVLMGEKLGSVRIDTGQFEQVLVNLSVNARDSMPDGGALMIETANTELDESYCARHPHISPGKYIMLAVSDTGHGMSDEVKKHLFEPFFTTKATGQGTGLGLATTFGAVKQAGGSIEVYSEIGKGTTFKIFLPRVDEQPSKPIRESPLPESLNGTETILVVEDETSLREIVLKILKRFGYKTLHAPNGGEAFMLAEKYTDRIDLLMTDVVMPGMNGRELAERLIKLHPEMKVLYTSGYTEDVIIHHGVIDANLNFLGKPYHPKGLAHKIREVLGPARE